MKKKTPKPAVMPRRVEHRNYYVANCLQRIHWAVNALPPSQHGYQWREVASAIAHQDADVRHILLCELMGKLEKKATDRTNPL